MTQCAQQRVVVEILVIATEKQMVVEIPVEVMVILGILNLVVVMMETTSNLLH